MPIVHSSSQTHRRTLKQADGTLSGILTHLPPPRELARTVTYRRERVSYWAVAHWRIEGGPGRFSVYFLSVPEPTEEMTLVCALKKLTNSFT